MESNLNIPTTDAQIDVLFPKQYAKLSATHWTPYPVAQQVSKWLCARESQKILDIGSGLGKFCIAGALQFPTCEFHGVEQREKLVGIATKIAFQLGLKNSYFIADNFINIDFHQFNSFYLYNPFWENISKENSIDQKLPLSDNLYLEYTQALAKKLKQLQLETQIVTYLMRQDDIPMQYQIQETAFNGDLILWKKIT